MFIIEREGRALVYLALGAWLLFGFWPAVLVLYIGYTGFLGEASFEEEDLPFTEMMAYKLPPYDMDIDDLEFSFTLQKRRDPNFERNINI